MMTIKVVGVGWTIMRDPYSEEQFCELSNNKTVKLP